MFLAGFPYAVCPLPVGKMWDATGDTFTRDTHDLSKVYLSQAPNDGDEDLRLVRIVKNASGGTLSASTLVRFDTAAGKYPKEIAGVTNADGGRCAGIVEPEYTSGVPNGKWFRIAVMAKKIRAILGNVNSSRIALSAGDKIIPYTNGQFIGLTAYADPADSPATADALRDDLVTAALANLTQRGAVIGKSWDTTTNVAGERGAYHYIELDCTRS